ncbi:MAG: Crp/Fnr family transcriptional regulator [Bacteroidetes bacterium]|nr:Crp/Fnr family transcriptional regulator [Bacteroidota bacterium]MCL5024988.1 Crp/Fnr family transcriptional regulator [Chloroflexota bacterium]
MATSEAGRKAVKTPPRPLRRPLLEALPYFTGLSPQARSDVEARLVRLTLEKGEAALLEGEPSDRLFFVAKGRLKLLRTSEGGREHILRLLRPGDSFNEVAVFDGGPAPATVMALEPVTLYYLRRKDVLELLSRYPVVAEQVTRYLAQQLRELVSMVEDLSFKHVSARLAKLLLTHAQPAAGNGAGLREHLTQQDMAAMIGTAREVVARSLRDLEQSGAIRIDRRRIIITNRKLLEELA